MWRNTASIVFDSNAAIQTPTFTNTLDTTPPVSRVQSLTPIAGGSSFTVAWSGSDTASGARLFTVFASDNGAAFTPWQTAVTSTSATYNGVDGHTYAFYVVATDGAGNAEAAKSSAEQTIVAGSGVPVAPSSSNGSGGGGCTIGSTDQRDAGLPLLMLGALAVLWRRRYAALPAKKEQT